MASLRSTITELASWFATGVVAAVRGASLEEIVAETSRGAGGAAIARRAAKRAPVTRAGHAAAVTEPVAAPRGGRASKRRLGRRSAADIGRIVERIVALLQQNAKGLRAERIKKKLGLQSNELPRPIAEALASKKISKQGEKRATTYFAGGARAAAPAAPGARKAGRPAKEAKKAGKAAKAAKTTAPEKTAKKVKPAAVRKSARRAKANTKRGAKASPPARKAAAKPVAVAVAATTKGAPKKAKAAPPKKAPKGSAKAASTPVLEEIPAPVTMTNGTPAESAS